MDLTEPTWPGSWLRMTVYLFYTSLHPRTSSFSKILFMAMDRFARQLRETFHVYLRPVTENCHTLNSTHIKLTKANHMTKSNISGLREHWIDQKVCLDFSVTSNRKSERTFWPTQYNLYMVNPWQGRGGKDF